jgi:hypothetical protein
MIIDEHDSNVHHVLRGTTRFARRRRATKRHRWDRYFDTGPAGCRCEHERARERVDPLDKRNRTQCARAQRGEFEPAKKRKSLSIVLENHFDPVALRTHFHPGVLGVRMPSDIAQPLLDEAINVMAQSCRHARADTAQELDLQSAMRNVPAQRRERIGQVLARPDPGLPPEAVDPSTQLTLLVDDQLLEITQALMGVFRTALHERQHRLELQRRTGQRLKHAIVELARDPMPLADDCGVLETLAGYDGRTIGLELDYGIKLSAIEGDFERSSSTHGL